MAIRDIVFLKDTRAAGGGGGTGPVLDPMVLVFDTTLPGANTTARVPLLGAHAVTIDWGDGTSQVFSAAAAATYTKTYAVAGQYTVKISGTASGFGSSTLSAANRANLLSCTSFGDLGMTTFAGAFRACPNLVSVPLQIPATITSTASMFQAATSFNKDIRTWSTGAVTDMNGMFQGATAFNQNIGNWDTTNVTNMSNMFNGAIAFNGDINPWPTQAVTNMSNMFKGATAFTRQLNSWKTAAVTNMSGMFSGATNFNSPLTSWNTAAVTDMNNMFFNATFFNQNISNWNTAAVTNMASMFQNATAFNQSVNTWNTAAVTNMANMFNGASNFNQDISALNTAAVTNMASMFKGATKFNCGQAAGVVHTLMQRTATAGWRTQGITSVNMGSMFNNASSFAGNISNWCVSGIAAAPTTFATGAHANFTVARQPTWGACPFPD